MTRTIKIKQGFNINLNGRAEKRISETEQPETFAIKPTDFLGIKRPKVLVQVGDNVKAGTPVLLCKTREKVKYTTPVSGEVVEIIRGEKRKLLEIRILADRKIEFTPFKKVSLPDIGGITREAAIDVMCLSGVWPYIIQRPYGIVANPEDEPRDIFISAFDSHPLAPDTDFILQGQEQNIQVGLDILKKLTPGQVYVTLNADGGESKLFSGSKNVEQNKISGPHPAGNVGVQIHHIKPINKGDIVWTVSPYGVAQIGKLFLEGKYDPVKVIALAGSEVKDPQYYKVRSGLNLSKLLEGKIKSDNVRIISGNVLTGEKINADSYLGYYDNLISVIPEGNRHEFLGWMRPTFEWLSFHRALGLLSFLNSKNKEYVLTTNTRGDKRAFVQTGVFEKVMPMDIYPTFLFKSILAEDYDEMEALGIYEVIEEDVALCEFVDVSKHDLQKLIRKGLDLLQTS
jgi:Na+-transporting NADH:ubiquinone oxidoreductase subunit A